MAISRKHTVSSHHSGGFSVRRVGHHDIQRKQFLCHPPPPQKKKNKCRRSLQNFLLFTASPSPFKQCLEGRSVPTPHIQNHCMRKSEANQQHVETPSLKGPQLSNIRMSSELYRLSGQPSQSKSRPAGSSRSLEGIAFLYKRSRPPTKIEGKLLPISVTNAQGPPTKVEGKLLSVSVYIPKCKRSRPPTKIEGKLLSAMQPPPLTRLRVHCTYPACGHHMRAEMKRSLAGEQCMFCLLTNSL